MEAQFSTAGTNYVYQEHHTLEYIEEYLTYTANYNGKQILGTIAFEEGQILSPGTHEYSCVFTPGSDYSDYAVKKCIVSISI